MTTNDDERVQLTPDDWQKSAIHRVFGRWTAANGTSEAETAGSTSPSRAVQRDVKVQARLVGTDAHVLGTERAFCSASSVTSGSTSGTSSTSHSFLRRAPESWTATRRQSWGQATKALSSEDSKHDRPTFSPRRRRQKGRRQKGRRQKGRRQRRWCVARCCDTRLGGCLRGARTLTSTPSPALT